MKAKEEKTQKEEKIQSNKNEELEKDILEQPEAKDDNEAEEKTVVKEINLDHKDKFIRLYSEYENYRKRTAKEKIDIITNASEGLLKEILPVIDDFERAITNNKKVDDASTIKEGFELIYNKLNKTLVNKGLKTMDSQGQAFDPDIHEAITKIPATSKKMKGKVVDVIEKGYMINEKVIRFAKVVVGE
jgi:molecular chaperone GrpE